VPSTPGTWGTILSIWAHPDDETYLAGGVMAAASANGQRVVCVTATDRGGGCPTFAELVAEEAFVAAPRPGVPPLRAAATPARA
jgi:LmbE family N-acetylglucosaminyl deacetylase